MKEICVPFDVPHQDIEYYGFRGARQHFANIQRNIFKPHEDFVVLCHWFFMKDGNFHLLMQRKEKGLK